MLVTFKYTSPILPWQAFPIFTTSTLLVKKAFDSISGTKTLIGNSLNMIVAQMYLCQQAKLNCTHKDEALQRKASWTYVDTKMNLKQYQHLLQTTNKGYIKFPNRLLLILNQYKTDYKKIVSASDH